MRALTSSPGGPTRVRLIDDAPEPAPAPDEALVAVEAFSLNRGELALLAGRSAGWRPGQDIAGTILTAAADGSGPPAGTPVVGLVEQAGWSERAAVPAQRLAPLPPGAPATAAATLPVAGRTALRTVALGGNLLGRRVLITAAGGVGRFQIQLAALAGAHVVTVSRHPDAHSALTDAGAHLVVTDIADAPGLFDLVLDGVGGRALTAALAKVAPAGTVVLIGATDPEPAHLTLLDFIGHENATIRSYFSYAPPDTTAADLAALAALLADGRLTAHIGLQADWRDTNGALDALTAGHIDGKAVLTIS